MGGIVPDGTCDRLKASYGLTLSWLQHHYHPFVAQFAGHVISDEVFPPQYSALTADSLYEQFDDSMGRLNPDMQRPRAHPLAKQAAQKVHCDCFTSSHILFSDDCTGRRARIYHRIPKTQDRD